MNNPQANLPGQVNLQAEWIRLDYILGCRKGEMTRFKILLLLLASLGMVQCELSTVYNPTRPDSAQFRVYHMGTYSSKLDENKEIQGTIFQTTLSYDLTREGTNWKLNRKVDTLIAKGYHKFSMPHELEKKLPLTFFMDNNFMPTRIDGYDSLKEIMGRIQQKEEYRIQLLQASDSAQYRAQWRDWWRIADLLPRGQKLIPKQSLPIAEINSKLETFQLDSAQFDGPRPRMKKSCLDYSVYYHRTDSLPLLVEQFYFSAMPNRKLRKYTHEAAIVAGILQYSVEAKSGLPCFQSKTESAQMTMKLASEKIEVPVYLYRYEEDLYE